jgi:cold shock CspA family protein
MATACGSCDKKLAGCVKWFNMKTGFGFLTVVQNVCGSDLKVGSEIFVHHSNVKVTDEQYRFLVQGEYVEFGVSNVANGQHSCQAVNVTGMFGGKLMCETRNEARQQRGGRDDEDSGDDSYVPVLRRTSSSSDSNSHARSSFSRSRGGSGVSGERGGRRS